MMNKYIEIEMTPTVYGAGGSFNTEAGFRLDNFKAPFYNIEVKIDTGCSISTIPLKGLKVSDTLCKLLKRIDIANDVPYFLSYGIETGGLKHKIPVTDEERMDCPAMKFEYGISDFVIGGVGISSDKICLNYDRSGNILIGMDVLENWDIHIGVSKKIEKSLLLACPFDNIYKEYFEALETHFGIGLNPAV